MGVDQELSTRSTLRDSVLGSAHGYRLFKVVTRGATTMGRIADQCIRPVPGERLLDVGCGYGDLSQHLPGVEYVGVDLNEGYLTYARRHHPDRGRFVLASVTDLLDHDLGVFDAVAAIGVLHHLTDEDAKAMLGAVSKLLKPGGRFVAAEPVWDPAQRTAARVLAALDRGRFVRDRWGYEQLVSPWFAATSLQTRHDLFWFPYSHCVITATAVT